MSQEPGKTNDEIVELSEKLRTAVDDHFRNAQSKREAYVTAWVAETGLLPSESVLVMWDEFDGTTIRSFCEVRRRKPQKDI